MDIKITKKDVIWGYTAQFLNYGTGIILLPIILRLLPSDILGIWYIFITISGFVFMLDFGFQPTFARNAAYLFNGATTLQAKGINNDDKLLNEPNYPLLRNAIHTMKRFYGLISLIVVFILLTAGTWYIHLKSSHLETCSEIIIAWYIYTISIVFNFFYSYFNALLIGRGMVQENNILLIVTKSIYVLFAAIGVVMGYGLIAIAIANMLSIVVNRILAVRFFYGKGLKQILKQTKPSDEKLFPIIWYNARKVGLTNLGGFFIQKGNLFFASIFLPLDTFASYGLTMNIVNILASVSPLYLSTHLPALYKDRINNNINSIRNIFGESLLVYYLLYIIGTFIILLGGHFFLELFHSKTFFIPFTPLLLLLIAQFLESNHGMASTLITTRNEIPFLKAALISGATVAILSFISLAYTPFGVTGIIIATGLVQLAYNNWKWPLMVCQELDKNYFQLLKIGFISLRGWFFRHYKGILSFK